MKKLVFGIDIGGTNTAFGLVDEKGEIFGESAISTRSYMAYDDYPRYIEDLAVAMKTLLGSINFAIIVLEVLHNIVTHEGRQFERRNEVVLLKILEHHHSVKGIFKTIDKITSLNNGLYIK